MAVVGLFAAMILWQPDLGTMATVVITVLIMLYIGGIHMKHLGSIIAVGSGLMLLFIRLEPYRVQRLATFLNRSVDPLGIGYQINQAILAIGSGGFWGYGYGLSRQKHNYLPETISDSVFAVMAEELGFFRVIIILLLFLAFALRGIKISLRTEDQYGRILASGLVASIALQTVINIGAITGLLPLTGITLPFFSYGSSSLIVTLASCGIVLNISRNARL
jgi:cell division protein FtsW